MMNAQHIVTLLSAPGVGRRTVQSVLDSMPSFTPTRADELRDVLLEVKSRYPKLRVPTDVELEAAYSNAEAILEQADALGIRIITAADADFPPQLLNIPDPPVVLYVKGDVASLSFPAAVAVIGTRDPSPFGAVSAERLGALLASKGIVVVSGLALGCDTAAHLGCLQARGQTVAVLAHGLDRVYPKENRALADSILDYDGCLVSEYPPGTPPRGNFFVDRDRVQSGLSAAVIVVETDVKGGTMHTVKFCLEQERLLGCLAHPPKFAAHPKARGNEFLIKTKQAVPLRSKEDVENFIALFFQPPPALSEIRPTAATQAAPRNDQLTFFGAEKD
jgi:DNA processing protein